MRLQTIILVGTVSQTVPCPAGKQIRIAAVFFNVTPTPGGLEQAGLTYSRGNTTVARCGSSATGDNVNLAQGGLGLSPVYSGSALADLTNQIVTQFPLLDIWWPHEITIAATFSLTPPTGSMTIIYELDDTR